MSPEQVKLLEPLKEALESQPEEPDYEDYEVRGLLTRDEYYSQQYEYDLVEDIRRILLD